MASIGQKLGASDTLRGPDAAAGLNLTAGRLRHWGVKSALSLVDQGFTSGAGFLVNLLLARRMPAPVYGAFAVAFAGYLFVSGFHNVLILEPMSVLGPSRHAKNLPAYFRAQLKIHALLVGALSAVVLLTSAAVWVVSSTSPLVWAMVGSGLTLPFLLLLWLVRRMCYVVPRPAAVSGSALYLVFVALGLVMLAKLGWLGSFAAFVLMGAGSAAAAFVLWRGIVHEETSAGTTSLSWHEILKENWSYGKWLVGSSVLSIANGQAQTFIVAAILGLEATGILRAMQLPSLLVTQVIIAFTLLMLPSLSHDFGTGNRKSMRRKAHLVSAILSLGAGIVSVIFLVFSKQLDIWLFGGRHLAFAWMISLLSVSCIASGFGSGFSMLLRTASQANVEFFAYCSSAIVSVISALILVPLYGIFGAAVSMVVGPLGLALVTSYLWWKQDGSTSSLGKTA